MADPASGRSPAGPLPTRLRNDGEEQIAIDAGPAVYAGALQMVTDVYAAKLHDLARGYGAHATASMPKPIIVAVERNNHGHAVLLRLRELHGGTAPYAIFRASDGRHGWLTSSANRPVLVDQLEAALRTGGLILDTAGPPSRAGRH